MRVDDRFAAIEFIEDGLERDIAEPLISPVAKQTDALCLEGVKRVLDFTQAGVDIRKRQHRE